MSIQTEIDKIIAAWKVKNPISWWSKIEGVWLSAVQFLLNTIDYLIKIVESNVAEGGPAKKAAVLLAMGKIYDAIVYPLLPVYLKVFSSRIKSFIIGVVASMMIDFIVSKYKDGSWTQQPADITKLI